MHPTHCVQHGDIISTPAKSIPFVRHFGIWDEFHRRVIHNALPVVQLATWEEFVNREARIERRPYPGYAEYVVARARAQLGQKYNLLTNNCEHFVNLAADGERKSIQLQRAFALAILGGAIAVGASRTGLA